jgi:hypothetical protein
MRENMRRADKIDYNENNYSFNGQGETGAW